MLRAFLIAGLVICADQVTKHLIRGWLGLHEVFVVTPFLNIVHVENRGAAFGMFAGIGTIFFIIVTLAAVGVIVFLLIRAGWERYPLALLLGGAVGNLIDRLIFGTVTDFVDVHGAGYHWPAFNVADSALTVGIIVIIAMEVHQLRRAPEGAP